MGEQQTIDVAAIREALGEACDALGEVESSLHGTVADLTGNRDWAGLRARLEAAYAGLPPARGGAG